VVMTATTHASSIAREGFSGSFCEFLVGPFQPFRLSGGGWWGHRTTLKGRGLLRALPQWSTVLSCGLLLMLAAHPFPKEAEGAPYPAVRVWPGTTTPKPTAPEA
jgi:hypothetical protein